MQFVSLANPAERATFKEAVINGVPSDTHSLYVPERIPKLWEHELDIVAGGDQIDVAKTMLRPYVEAEIDEKSLERIVEEATTFDTPLRWVGDRRVLDLTQGPTMAFKDVAAAYLGSFMSYFYGRGEMERSTILVATSGDTGGAIAEGMADKEGVEVVVAYPKGEVSQLQEAQLRRVADNIHSVEVEGTFNDCLALTEAAFHNYYLKQDMNLTTANSINVGRLLPQMTYYAGLAQHLKEGFDGRIVVPSGNLGNITAGLLAAEMGVELPVFVAATNANDSLVRYLASGKFEPKGYARSISNAMNVNNPKNMPRLRWLFGDEVEAVRDKMTGVSVTDPDTVETIQRVYAETKYVLDPHTAVAWRASRPGDIIVSTASAAKFAGEIEEAAGIKVDNSEELAKLKQRPERYTCIKNDVVEFTRFLKSIA